MGNNRFEDFESIEVLTLKNALTSLFKAKKTTGLEKHIAKRLLKELQKSGDTAMKNLTTKN